jgi:hypothetical protein
LFSHARPPEHGGEHQWRHSSTVVGVYVRPVFQQQGYDFLAALERRAAEWRLAAIVPAVHSRSLLQKHSSRFRVAVVTRQHQQAVPAQVRKVQRESMIQHLAQCFRFTFAREIDGELLQFGVTLLFGFCGDDLHITQVLQASSVGRHSAGPGTMPGF